MSAPDFVPLSDQASAQQILARAEGALHACLAAVERELASMWGEATAEGELSDGQRLRLFLPIEEHAKHHDHLNRSWGICNGWSNPLLDAIDYREKHIWIRTQLLGSGRPLWEHQRAVRGLSG